MPEAVAVAFVILVTFAGLIAAKVMTLNPSPEARRDDVSRLQHQRAWLESRLELAQREGWDRDMQRMIAHELAVTCAQLEGKATRSD